MRYGGLAEARWWPADDRLGAVKDGEEFGRGRAGCHSERGRLGQKRNARRIQRMTDEGGRPFLSVFRRAAEKRQKRPRVLICDPLDAAGMEILAKTAVLDVKPGLSPAELLPIIGRYQAVIVGQETRLSEHAIEQGYNLRVIGCAGPRSMSSATTASRPCSSLCTRCSDISKVRPSMRSSAGR